MQRRPGLSPRLPSILGPPLEACTPDQTTSGEEEEREAGGKSRAVPCSSTLCTILHDTNFSPLQENPTSQSWQWPHLILRRAGAAKPNEGPRFERVGECRALKMARHSHASMRPSRLVVTPDVVSSRLDCLGRHGLASTPAPSLWGRRRRGKSHGQLACPVASAARTRTWPGMVGGAGCAQRLLFLMVPSAQFACPGRLSWPRSGRAVSSPIRRRTTPQIVYAPTPAAAACHLDRPASLTTGSR